MAVSLHRDTGPGPHRHPSAEAPAPSSIAVIIPAYRVRDHILGVIGDVGREVSMIIVVDDACPEKSGDFVEQTCTDPRVTVVRHDRNQGVGGAVLTGMREAMARGADVLVKVDGDGQMDATLAGNFAAPIVNGQADYVKGNRFFYLEASETMPFARRAGNLALTFISRFSTGYYSLSDPTNGYIAIDRRLAECLPVEKLAKRYFFETDLLFRINTLGAKVVEIPHNAVYGDEESSLNVRSELFQFAGRHVVTLAKRLFYQYVLRDFNPGSVLLFLGLVFAVFGTLGVVSAWTQSVLTGIPRSGGAVALLEVLVILSTIFLVGFLNYDIGKEPKQPISWLLGIGVGRPASQFKTDD